MSLTPPTCRPRSAYWLPALLVLAASTVARAQDQPKPVLRWTFEPGQTLRYTFHQVTDMQITSGGQQVDRLNDLKIDLTWKVEAVAEDGTATISQTVDKVHAEVTAGDQSILYDSAENKAEGPGVSSLSDLYGSALGEPYTLKLSANGDVLEVKVPDRVTEALKGSPFQAIADGGSVFSPDGVKRMLAQAMPRLNGEATAVGTTWDTSLEVPSGPLLMKLSHQYKLTEVEDAAATITSSIGTSVEARPGAPLKVTLKSQSGEGSYRFGLQPGHLVRTTLKQAFEMEFKVGEQTTSQEITITLSFEQAEASK